MNTSQSQNDFTQSHHSGDTKGDDCYENNKYIIKDQKTENNQSQEAAHQESKAINQSAAARGNRAPTESRLCIRQ